MIFNLLFYATIGLFSLGQLGRISFFSQQVNFYLYEIPLILLTLYLIIEAGWPPFKQKSKLLVALLIFFTVMLFSLCINLVGYSPKQNLIAFIYYLRLLSYFTFYFYLRNFIRNSNKTDIVFRGIVVVIAITALTSVFQFLLYPDLRNLLYQGWDPHLYRLFGVYLDTSVAAGIYGLSFLFLYHCLTIKNVKLVLIILTVLYFIFCVLTYSRSLYISLALTVFLILIKTKKFRLILVFVLIFTLAVVIAPKPQGEGVNLFRIFSIESRFADYQQGVKIWFEKPWLGIGYNHIRQAKIEDKPQFNQEISISHAGASFHSSFLIILVTSGVIGLVAFLYLLYRLGSLSQFSQVIIVFLSLLSLTDNILLHPFILFYLIITLVYSFTR